MDVREFGAVGGGADDRAAFQAALDSLDVALGGTIVIPRGMTFRCTDFLRARCSHLRITGGGTIWFDSVSLTNTRSDRYTAGLVIGSDAQISTTAMPDVLDIHSVVSGESLHDIVIEDVTLRSNGHYGAVPWNLLPGEQSNIPLDHCGLLIWCADDVTVRDVRFTGWYSDALEVWGCAGLTVRDCAFSDVGFNGMGVGFASDVEIHHNTGDRVAQPYEGGGLRTKIHHNTFRDVAMCGIMVSTGAARPAIVDCEVSRNVIIRNPEAPEGFTGIAMGTEDDDPDHDNVRSMAIVGNEVQGSWTGITAISPAATGTCAVTNNALTMTAAEPAECGIELACKEGADVGEIECSGNSLLFTTGSYNVPIHAALYSPRVRLSKNRVIAPRGFRYTQGAQIPEGLAYIDDPGGDRVVMTENVVRVQATDVIALTKTGSICIT